VLPCVILAGGLGTRMRPQTDALPKALIPVNGRPFAELQLEWLRSRGVEDVVLCIGYRGDMVRDTLGSGERFGLRISYVDDGERLRGTGGALRLALDEGALPGAFFLLNGDSYLDVDLAAVEAAWRARGAPALMVVFHNEDRWDRSNAVFEDGLVRYDKRDRSGAPQWIDYGLSVLTREAVEERVAAGGVADIADVMAAMSQEGLVAGFEAGERFYEVGSPEGLAALEARLAAAPKAQEAAGRGES
jgi:NDP-sugar pyrophosphorylase family protein